MEIVELSQNDDIIGIVRKCNANFKQIAWSEVQEKKRNRTDASDMADAIVAMRNDLDAFGESIPSQISDQIASMDIAGQIAAQIASMDIAGQIAAEVAAQISSIAPPVGSYMMMPTNPSSEYPGTTWTGSGTISPSGGSSVQLWRRTA